MITEIECVYENKFLGVILDHKICWKPHRKCVRAKVAKNISVILNYKSLHILYCTIILPYLNYCVEVWGNTYKTTINSLIILQKLAVRILHNAGYFGLTNILFLKSHILNFADLMKYKTAQIMYRARYKVLPDNVQKIFLDKDVGSYLTGPLNFKKPPVRTTPEIMCATLWNGLDDELQQSKNINKFKNRMKKISL